MKTVEEIALKVLEKKNPSIYNEIMKQMEPVVKSRSMDYLLIPGIIDRFCVIKGIEKSALVGNGKTFGEEVHDLRRECIGVIMMFYVPEKLIYMDNRSLPRLLRVEVSRQFGICASSIAMSVPKIQGFYKIYKSFRNNVNNIHCKINSELFCN